MNDRVGDDLEQPLCLVCCRRLSEAEPQTCTRCLGRAQSLLSGIRTMFDELPRHLQTLSGSWAAGSRGGGDGRPLPGGDVLALLGRGSEGLAETAETSRDSDPTSVAYELGWWANTWAEQRRDPRPVADVWPARRQVRVAAGYLARHDGWAASSHSGFADYLHDLRRLHGRLEVATGRGGARQVAEAECFDCGGELERRWKNGTRCGHVLPPFPPEAIVPWGVRFSVEERRALHAWQRERWEAVHGRCVQGGFDDRWTCQRCGAVYEWERYLLALRAHLAAYPAKGWSLPEHVAITIGVSAKTVRSWAKRGVVAAACVVGDRRVRVWFPEVAEQVERRREVERRRAARAQERAAS